MPEYMLERYVSRTQPDAVDAGAEGARRAVAELQQEGTAIRYLRSIFVPEDETCLDLYEAPSPDDVREVARRADVSFERVTEIDERRGEPR